MDSINRRGIEYSVFIGEEITGETRVMRNPTIGNDALREINVNEVRTLWEAIQRNAVRRANANCLGTRQQIDKYKYGPYQWKTYRQVYDEAIEFATGASVLNLSPEIDTKHDGKFKFFGIYSKNREEWVISDLASHCDSVTIVTIYDTLGDRAIQFILEQTQLLTMLVESKNLKKILSLAKEKHLGNLTNLIVLDDDDKEAWEALVDVGFNLYTFQQIKDAGKGKTVSFVHAKPETIMTICYTSGTTGLPKGAMISHRAMMVETDILASIELTLVDEDVYLSFLPLAHIMERLINCVIITTGISIGFYTGNPTKIIDDAKELHPTVLCGVPKIFQRIYEAINKQIDQTSGTRKKLAEKAIAMKLHDYHKYGTIKHAFWDMIVFKKIRDILGGKVRWMLTGGAPMDPNTLNFLKIAFSSYIVEGYGQTEDCAGMLISHIQDNITGHLGGPGFSNEVKLVDCAELGYTCKDINPETNVPEPRGEICIRGPILFSGYLNDTENTKKAIDKDGWLHTGDVGIILTQHGNAIRIIDRVKNIFKLSQGEYIAPEKLENVLSKSHYINQIFVYGDSFQSYLVAIVVPRPETCVEFLQTKGITSTKDNVDQYYTNQDLIQDITKHLEILGKDNDFKGFEIIKKLYLTSEIFSTANDLATPTMKLKRHECKKKYTKQIYQMYGAN